MDIASVIMQMTVVVVVLLMALYYLSAKVSKYGMGNDAFLVAAYAVEIAGVFSSTLLSFA